MNEILKCDHSNESCGAVLSCGAVYYTMQVGSNFENVGEILPLFVVLLGVFVLLALTCN